MIKAFVEAWEAKKGEIERVHRKTAFPDDYAEVVRRVVVALASDGDRFGYGNCPDPGRIHEIDDGHYQGTLLYVVGATGYQPSTYFAVAVDYGSCSGCDTLEGLRPWGDGVLDDECVAGLMDLSLHIVQGFKQVAGWNQLDTTEAPDAE